MNFPNTPFESPRKSIDSPLDAVNKAVVDLLGGEPLEGSGFEAEMPEPGFQFDWMMPKKPSKGGSR